ncbi:MAG: T9SS type A sorting domain-containing protein [Balneolaceae bacterium]
MLYRTLSILLVTLFVVNMTADMPEPANEYKIEGTITAPDGNPAAGLAVELHNTEGEVIATDLTSSNGTYLINYSTTSSQAENAGKITEFELGDVYPNPVGAGAVAGKAQIPVQIAKNNTYQIEVYTINGRLVTRSEHSLSSGAYTVDVGLPETAGMYLVRVRGEGVNEVRKLTSLSGNNASINIRKGNNFPQNRMTKNTADGESFTLKVLGESQFQDQSIEIEDPGDHIYNFSMVLQSTFETCSDLELAETSSTPGNEIVIKGIGEKFGDEPWAWFYDDSDGDPGEENRHLTYVERVSDNEAFMVVPLHPGDKMDGGTGTLVLFNDETGLTCPEIDFEIEPLTPAPGTFLSMVDDMETFVENEAQRLGHNPETLRNLDLANLNEDDWDAAPFASLLQIIDGPNYPNNLRARLSGNAPDYDYEPEAFELLDALLAKSDSLIFFEEYEDNLEASMKIVTGPACTETAFDITTPETLDCWMKEHEFFDKYVKQNWDMLSNGFEKYLSLLSVSPDPLTQSTTDALTSYSQFFSMMLSMVSHILPSELVGMTIDANPESFMEEETEAGDWEAALTAKSQDWTFDLVLAAGMFPVGPGAGTKILTRKANFSEGVQEAVESAFDDQLATILDTGIGKIEFEALLSEVTVDPEREEEDYYFNWELTEVETETGHPAVIFSDNDTGLMPNAIGKSELRIETTGEEAFLGQESFNNIFLEVEPIEISIQEYYSRGSRTIHHIGEDEDFEIMLWAEVYNATDKKVEWELEVEDGPAPIQSVPAVTLEDPVHLIAPEEDAVYKIDVTSLADEGLRSDGNAPPRTATTYIFVEKEPKQLMVMPDPPCVTLDMTPPPFSAYLNTEEIDMNDLSWELEGPGSISANGAYVPAEEGFVSIEFTYDNSSLDEPLTSEVNFLAIESCGTITVSSSFFDYTATFASADSYYEDLDPVYQLSSITGAWSSPADIIITFPSNISEEGEWTREFVDPWVDEYSWWQIPTFIGSGDEWVQNNSYPNSHTFTIERREEMIDGKLVGFFSGSFTSKMLNWTEYENSGQEIHIVMTGEFTDVPYNFNPPGEVPSFDK